MRALPNLDSTRPRSWKGLNLIGEPKRLTRRWSTPSTNSSHEHSHEVSRWSTIQRCLDSSTGCPHNYSPDPHLRHKADRCPPIAPQPFVTACSRTGHRRLASAREDAGELASDFVQLARATYRLSPEEAAVHFQAALDITDAIGDDAGLARQTLLAIADSAARDPSEQAGRAYRLGQIAESVEPYLGDSLYYTGILATASRLSFAEALATGSRWRDRRVASIGDAADAITTNPDVLMVDDPLAALALLPLGDRHPDHQSLATALSVRPEATSAVRAYLHFRRRHPLTAAALDELLSILASVARRSTTPIHLFLDLRSDLTYRHAQRRRVE